MFDLIQARVDTIGGIPVRRRVRNAVLRASTALVKRASDIVLASAILRPDLAAHARDRDRRQAELARAGAVQAAPLRLDGREIVVYKFRTMTVLEDGGDIRQATRDDRARDAASARSCARPRSTSCRSSSTCCRGA